MALQWIEDDARLAEEWGWRAMRALDHTTDAWFVAFSIKSSPEWQIRCTGENTYWIVRKDHNWGKDPAKQDVDGPFPSFRIAANTYQLLHSST